MQKISTPFARIAIFVIYFWFGLLKVVGQSPASPMVKTLFDHTMGNFVHFITHGQFIIIFGIFEMIVGIAFLIPKFQKIAVALVAIHIITTTLPLFVLSKMIWVKFLVPTLEGQYIIKNVAIVGLVISIAAHSKKP